MAGLNKYRAYSEYNFTNIEGLVQLPSQWELKQVRYLLKDGAEGTKIGPFGSSLKLEDMVDDGVQVYGQENVIKRDFSLGKRRISFNKFKEMGVYQVFFGDILITMMGTSGKCEIVPQTAEKGIIDSHLIRVRVNNKQIIPDFFKLLVDESPEIKHQIKIQGKGSIMLGLNSGVIRSLYLPLPGISEQKLILGFLDYETKKIDNLIEKQQQLIELLKEKRQAVISHAVTKGLNPDVPMKDSGVEWLGEVPEHWIIKRLKHISPKVGVGLVINPSTYTKDEGVYFIFGGDVKEFGFDLTKTRRISPQDSNKLLSSRLNSRDLVSVRVGYPGITSVVTDDLEGSNCASIIIIRRGSYNSDWLCAAMNVWVGRQQVDLASYGAAQKQFNVSDAIEFVFPVPPINEQSDIADFVQKTLSKFDDLTQKALKQIELLQERRTALISAAVTGKIDVRDWVAPDTQVIEESQEAIA
ncbi:restriction endonuclease subunit S [Pantoea dispersa]|uniref:restriction endonuclease subunit S n=1 Tax=Pantoea dispersa TaxID=59814 RepID=UPI0030D485AD